METFKGNFDDKQFYFKPQNSGEYYLIEPYQQKGLKGFNITRRKSEEINGSDKREWEIPSTANVPDWVRGLELDFNNFIQGKLGLTA
jgi:hypothetical protein